MTIRFRSPAQRAYTWRVGLAMGVYLVSLPAAVHFVGQGVVSRTDPLAWILALIPGIAVAAIFWAYGKMLIEETDEYQRLLHVRQSLIATGFTLGLVTIYGFLENFGLVGHVDAFYVAILWFFGLGIGGLVNRLTLGTEA
ncbi:hypothetical protein [Sphingomonas sp.]|uniref:hypothetical protein n=1 Tax=Sphingomonas sp. TaxID=28214 RepID=UPI00375293F8